MTSSISPEPSEPDKPTEPSEIDRLRQRNQELERDLERERELTELVFRSGHDASGEDFLRGLLVAVATRLRMDGAMVGRIDKPGRIQTIAFWLDGEFQANVAYDLEGTPCAEVLGNRLRTYRRDVARKFPQDQMLVDLDLEAYVGSRLLDSKGEHTGLIAVFGRQPLEDPGHAAALLRIAAARASMELERAAWDRALQISNERFATVAEHMPVLMNAFDASGNVLYWNRAAEITTGYTADEIVANPSMMELLYPDAEYRRAMLDEWRARGDHIDWEWTLTTKDGEPRTIAWFNVSTKFPIPGWASWGIGIDVTERKKAERQRQKLASQLRQAQKMEAIGQLAGGVAHDFNNLLTVIQGNTEVVRDELTQDSGESPQTHTLEHVLAAAQQASAVTRQLLTFSRRQVTTPRRVDLGGTLRDMESALRRILGAPIDLQVDVVGQDHWVLADIGDLDQVILNLTVNARDAMPDGGRLTLRLEHSMADQAPSISFTVRDTGEGMPQSVIDRAFEPFFTTKPRGIGTGLGLATVYGIIEAAGGTVRLESEKGHGTCVWVDLPAVVPPTNSAAGEPAHPNRIKGGNETILLCEDDDAVREFVSHSLSMAGYRVLAAESARVALDLAAQSNGSIDLLVTDVILPEQNGLLVAEAFASTHPKARTLFVSGFTADIVSRYGGRLDEQNFLAKPFTRAQLLERVRTLCEAGSREP